MNPSWFSIISNIDNIKFGICQLAMNRIRTLSLKYIPLYSHTKQHLHNKNIASTKWHRYQQTINDIMVWAWQWNIFAYENTNYLKIENKNENLIPSKDFQCTAVIVDRCDTDWVLSRCTFGDCCWVPKWNKLKIMLITFSKIQIAVIIQKECFWIPADNLWWYA